MFYDMENDTTDARYNGRSTINDTGYHLMENNTDNLDGRSTKNDAGYHLMENNTENLDGNNNSISDAEIIQKVNQLLSRHTKLGDYHFTMKNRNESDSSFTSGAEFSQGFSFRDNSNASLSDYSSNTGNSGDSPMSNKSQLHEAFPQFPSGLPMMALTLSNRAEIHSHILLLLSFLSQSTLKLIAKHYIKHLEPRKQSLYPYCKGDASKPDWWPKKIRHREPDHLNRFERGAVMVDLLRYVARNDIKQRGNILMSQNTDNQRIRKEADSGEKMTISDLKTISLNQNLKLTLRKKQILSLIFLIVEKESEYNLGLIKNQKFFITNVKKIPKQNTLDKCHVWKNIIPDGSNSSNPSDNDDSEMETIDEEMDLDIYNSADITTLTNKSTSSDGLVTIIKKGTTANYEAVKEGVNFQHLLSNHGLMTSALQNPILDSGTTLSPPSIPHNPLSYSHLDNADKSVMSYGLSLDSYNHTYNIPNLSLSAPSIMDFKPTTTRSFQSSDPFSTQISTMGMIAPHLSSTESAPSLNSHVSHSLHIDEDLIFSTHFDDI